MNYLGVDYHKRHSHVTVVDEVGRVLRSARVNNEPAEFEELLAGLEGPNHAVVEASRTGGTSEPLGQNLLNCWRRFGG